MEWHPHKRIDDLLSSPRPPHHKLNVEVASLADLALVLDLMIMESERLSDSSHRGSSGDLDCFEQDSKGFHGGSCVMTVFHQTITDVRSSLLDQGRSSRANKNHVFSCLSKSQTVTLPPSSTPTFIWCALGTLFLSILHLSF